MVTPPVEVVPLGAKEILSTRAAVMFTLPLLLSIQPWLVRTPAAEIVSAPFDRMMPMLSVAPLRRTCR